MRMMSLAWMPEKAPPLREAFVSWDIFKAGGSSRMVNPFVSFFSLCEEELAIVQGEEEIRSFRGVGLPRGNQILRHRE
jgi:hypothetical protein